MNKTVKVSTQVDTRNWNEHQTKTDRRRKLSFAHYDHFMNENHRVWAKKRIITGSTSYLWTCSTKKSLIFHRLDWVKFRTTFPYEFRFIQTITFENYQNKSSVHPIHQSSIPKWLFDDKLDMNHFPRYQIIR